MAHNGRERYLQYYSQVQSVLTSPEIEKFTDLIEKPLPITFWICHPTNADAILAEIRDCLGENFADSLQLLGWQGEFLACSIDIPREILRKSGELSKLKDLLIKYQEVGFIWRQEEVSMLPPLFLNIAKGDAVLDVCAAPGSKTAQLLYLLGKQNATEGRSYTYEAGSGYVVANDSNCKRLDMLIHRVKTLDGLFPYGMFANHDARYFPALPSAPFTKILCDVPCTGDGTVRKSPIVLREWRESNAYTLHPIQLDIALQAASLLAVGGLMVYSTCSLNPIENEAVVHSVLRICGGSMGVVDPCEYSFASFDGEQGKFRVRPGMTHWSINSDFAKNMPKRKIHSCSPDCAPPDAEADAMGLQKTMRILPHDQNTGGFFIAVLKKTKPLPWEMGDTDLTSVKAQGVPRTVCEYFAVPQALVDEIVAFYSLGNVGFHGHLVAHRVSSGEQATTANALPPKTISFVSKSVSEVLLSQNGVWNIVNAGLRIFSVDRPRKDIGTFPWRVCNEGVQLLLHVLTKHSRLHGSFPFTGDLSNRILSLPPHVVLELLRSPKKFLSIERFTEILGESGAHTLSTLAPGGLVFSVPASASLFPGFSGLLTKHSVQATISDREMPTYIHVFQKLCDESSLDTREAE